MSVRSPFDLTGRTALVTGGNQGLGKAFAFGLAEAGAKVAIAGRSAERNATVTAEAATAGHAFLPITADITSSADVERMTAEAVAGLGHVDILVNNAGTCYHGESWVVTEDQWDDVFDLNVKALWACSLAVGAHMRERGSGSVVNIGSMSGIIVNRPQMQPAYNASKAAVHHLTKSLAAEWAPLGIRVNAVAPGYCKTEMAPVDRPDLKRYWIDDAPQQRYALPEEIAPSVVFLASDAASFITGSVLVADGGVHRMVNSAQPGHNRRVVVNALDDVVFETVPETDPADGEVRIRSTVIGICGSDLHAACGRHPFIDLPYRPGHEVVGIVEAVGAGVDESWVGSRVVVEPNLACGHCPQCRDGRYNICRELLVLGCQTPGGLADTFTVPVDRLIALDADLDDDHAILIEPLATPIHAVRRAAETVGDLSGRPVVVIGAGPIGLFVLLAALDAGANVVVADLLQSKRDRAERLGAAGTFDPTAPDAVETALALLGGPAAVVIDCVARESSVAQAVDLVDKGGAVMIVGVAAGATPVRLDLIQDRELALIGNLMYVREDFTAAIELLSAGAVPIDEIISARFDFEHSAEAFSASADPEQVKVVVTVGSSL